MSTGLLIAGAMCAWPRPMTAADVPDDVGRDLVDSIRNPALGSAHPDGRAASVASWDTKDGRSYKD
jgi:hypothetical protein